MMVFGGGLLRENVVGFCESVRARDWVSENLHFSFYLPMGKRQDLKSSKRKMNENWQSKALDFL